MDKFKYYDSEKITGLNEDEIFVFGSNLRGIHGAGAAKTAREKFGAKQGFGHGLTGRSYALATKDEEVRTLPLIYVNYYVAEFMYIATISRDYMFIVTKVGCGLAGYTDAEIAPMFRLAPDNCMFHKDWKEYLE